MTRRGVFAAAIAAAIAALVVALLPAAAQAEVPPIPHPRLQHGDLLVANHSFEDGTAGWRPSGIRGGPTPPPCRDALATTNAWSSDGEHALELSGAAPCVNAGAASQPVAAVPGETYTAYAHAQSAGRPQIGLRWLDAQGSAISSSFSGITRQPTDPGILTVSAAAPPGAAAVEVELDAHGSARFDDVLITARYTELGPQITKPAQFLGMATGVDDNGRSVVYSVATGSANDPATLIVVDVLSGQIVRTVPLPGATGAWAINQNPVTKTVYIGTYSAPALWLYTPGDSTATNVGAPPIKAWGFMYDMVFDENGVAYGGGWGDPTAGFAGPAIYKYVEGKGYEGTLGPNPLITGVYYDRAVAYDNATHTVFAGTGTKAHLFACSTVGDADCHDLIGLFNTDVQNSPWVYGLTAGDGYAMAWAGDGASHGNDYLIVMKVSRDAAGQLDVKVLAQIKGVVYNGSSPVVDNKIYYTTAGDSSTLLHSYDVVTGEESTLPDAPVHIYSRRWEAVQLDDPDWPGTTIVGWDSHAELVKYNIDTHQLARTAVENVPRVSLQLNSVVAGPDGQIWTAGYLTGGLGAVPTMRDDGQTTYAVGGQAESMTSYRGRVYQGTYPYGRIESFAPSEVEAGNAPRVDCLIGSDQDRPYGILGHGDRIYYGSQATYGASEGAFGWLDLTTGQCTTLHGVIGNQSINTIAASGDKVFGGGNIFYSWDGTPTEQQAKLLVFDESTQQAKVVPWPVPNTRAIEASATVPDGTVWFYADGWLLAMNPATEQWVFQQQIFPDWQPGARIAGNYGAMTLDTDGDLYGNVGGRVFGFDPAQALATGSVDANLRILFQGAGVGITHDAYGNLYTIYASTKLLRINPQV